MGLMQEECPSPSLFDMYINDIKDYFNKIDDARITIEGRKICVLKYADGLQKSLIHYIHTVYKINRLLTHPKVR